jgi:hypothetical protein
MATSDYDETWVPRIGPDAARQLRRSGSVSLLVLPMVLVSGVAYGDLEGINSIYVLVFWFAAFLLSLLTFTAWLRGRIELARAVSAWYGTSISWLALPRMRPASFDAWCARRGLEPVVMREPDYASDPAPARPSEGEPEPPREQAGGPPREQAGGPPRLAFSGEVIRSSDVYNRR